MLEQYGALCRQLKTVVLPISYFTFFYPGFEGTDYWWYAINYKIYMDCPYHSNFSKYNFELAHSSVYKGKLKNLFLKRQNPICDSLGWGMGYTLDSKSSTWETTDAISAAQRHTEDKWEYIEENLSYFNQIVSYCCSRSISLILITTPVWHTYRENLEQKQLTKMYSLIHDMQQEYDLPYYDYLEDSRFVADDFYDSDHLTETGAQKFSRILEEEIFNR